MRKIFVCTVGVALATLGGCRREINSKSAVEKAIRTHLERDSNLALNAFTTEISDIKFEGDSATAVVKFKSKQVPDVSVQVRYTLRKDDNQWVVQSSSVNPHGGGTPGGQGTNPHGGLGTPTTPPPSSQPQPAPSH